MSWLGSALGAVGSIAGGLISGGVSRDSAREQMAFQERMSGTAYQRSMADMKAAGLNPILAYQQGGSSTPSGAGYSLENIGASAVSSARSANIMKAEVDQLKAQTDTQRTMASLQQAQERLANTQNLASAAQAKRDLASERLINEQTVKTGFEALAAREGIATARAEAGLRALELQGSSRYGTSPLGRVLEGTERGVGRAWGSVKDMFKAFPDWYRSLTKKGAEHRKEMEQ